MNPEAPSRPPEIPPLPPDAGSPAAPGAPPPPEPPAAPAVPPSAHPPEARARVARKPRVARATCTDEEVLAALAQLGQTRTSPLRAVLLLAVSLLLFIILGLFQDALQSILILVLVIFVHEIGHYLGMKGFGYRDVKMFFIPLFGGGVSGESFRVPEYQRAIVSLLGPVPGVMLGSALLLGYAFAPIPWLAQFGLFFLALNLFNLLPIFPLDGGHFFEHILFRRSRYAEAAFRVLAGTVLLGAWALLEAWWLLLLGFLTFTSISYNFRLRTIAEDIRHGLEPLPEGLGETPPPVVALAILARVRPAFSYLTKPKPLAEQVKRVWEQVNTQPAGALATVLLLAAYVGTFFLALLVAVVLAVSPPGAAWLQSHQQAAAEGERLKSTWEECVQEGHQALVEERYTDAEAAYREALGILDHIRATDFCRGQTLLGLGRALDLQGKSKEAEAYLKEALALHEKEPGRNHPHTVEALEALAANCRKLGNPGEAEALEARARAARQPAVPVGKKARDKADNAPLQE